MPKRTIELMNYSDGEGDCKCGCGLPISAEMVLCLQAFNAVLSRIYGAPIRHDITSGARCLKHNSQTPGASPSSKHIHGDACDGHWSYKHRGKWVRIESSDVAMAAVKSGLFGGVGYLRYQREGTNIVHLDIRPGPTVTW